MHLSSAHMYRWSLMNELRWLWTNDLAQLEKENSVGWRSIEISLL